MIDEKCAVHIGHILSVMAELALSHSLKLLERQGELEDLAVWCITGLFTLVNFLGGLTRQVLNGIQ